MTYRQLDQFLRTEKWRTDAQYGADMCGRYARCAYCDRSSAYPCAYAFDALVRTVGLDGGAAEWTIPEPPVGERFGTVYAELDGIAADVDYGAYPAYGAYAYPDGGEEYAVAETPAQTPAEEPPVAAEPPAEERRKARTIAAPKKTPRPREVIKIAKISGDACVLKIKRKQK